MFRAAWHRMAVARCYRKGNSKVAGKASAHVSAIWRTALAAARMPRWRALAGSRQSAFGSYRPISAISACRPDWTQSRRL